MMLAAVCEYAYNNYREVLLVDECDEVSRGSIEMMLLSECLQCNGKAAGNVIFLLTPSMCVSRFI